TLAYTLQSDPESRVQALGVGLVMLNIMLFTGIIVMYPLAQHFGRDGEERPPVGNLIRSSLLDIRALGLYIIVLAFALNLGGVPFPHAVTQTPLLRILIYCSAFFCYAGIGLRLRVGDSATYWREHVLLVIMKFGFCPALAIGALLALRMLGSEPNE